MRVRQINLIVFTKDYKHFSDSEKYLYILLRCPSFSYIPPVIRLHYFPGKPVTVFDNPLHEEILPNTLSNLPLVQLETASSRSITCHLRKETNILLAATYFRLVESNEVSPQPLFLTNQPFFLHQFSISLIFISLIF